MEITARKVYTTREDHFVIVLPGITGGTERRGCTCITYIYSNGVVSLYWELLNG